MWFQSSVAVSMKSSLFWDVTQCWLVVSDVLWQSGTPEDGTNSLFRNICNYQTALRKFPEERIFQAQKDLSTSFSNVLFFETRGLRVLWIIQIPQGILNVVRFPHLLTEDSALLDSSACMYRAAHRDTVTWFRSVLFSRGCWWYRYLCKERGGCRVECQQGQLVSWRWGLTALIRNWSYLGRAWHDGWMDALSKSLNIFMRIIATVLPRPQHFIILSRPSIRGCCNGSPCATVRLSVTPRLVGVTHS